MTPRCTACGADWGQGAFTPGCEQCGGSAMQAPCLICGGRCGALWERSVDDSQDANLAHWHGNCRLPKEERDRELRKRSSR